MLKPGLYVGPVMHQRLRPRRHRFTYRCLWLMLDLDRLPSPTRLFAVNRFALFSFHERDHADGAGPGLRDRIARKVRSFGIPAEGRILLLTMPRVLGHGFNPLSIYFCHDEADRLRGIVWEVTSTFGERHSYVLAVPPAAGTTIRQRCAKMLHVSPFLDMDLEYRFRVIDDGDELTICLADCDAEGVILTAAMQANWAPLGDRQLLRALAMAIAWPFRTLLAIHWEALRLALRRVPLFRHRSRADRALAVHSATAT